MPAHQRRDVIVDVAGGADRPQAERLVLAAELGVLVVDQRLHRKQEERTLALEDALQGGEFADQSLSGRCRRTDDEMLAREDTELVHRVLLQLVERRDRFGPGVDEVGREAERLKTVDVFGDLRLVELGERGGVPLSGREHRPSQAPVERPA